MTAFIEPPVEPYAYASEGYGRAEPARSTDREAAVQGLAGAGALMAEERRLGWLRASIFTRLLAALLLVALLPLTAFWQLERQRMTANGEAEARERLELFADNAVQQVDGWMRLNLSVLQLAAGEGAMRSMRPQQQLQAIE